MRVYCISLAMLLVIMLPGLCHGQQSMPDQATALPDKLFASIHKKASSLNEALGKQTEKYLRQLAKKEARLTRKLAKTDSTAAAKLTNGDVQTQYASFLIQQQNKVAGGVSGGQYMPNADSLQTSLSFLNKNAQLLSGSKQVMAVGQSLASVEQLNGKFQNAEQLKQFIAQRKQQLKNAIMQSINASGLKKYYDDYNKAAYYYSEQVREYKEALNDPDKLMKKALVVLNKLPAFQQFMQQNGALAGLFGVPANYNSAQAIQGLQTRDQVQQLLQTQLSAGGPNAMSQLQSSLQSAHQGLDQLKDKLQKLGNGSGDMESPDFKPNQQKTKSILKRIEVGSNLQTQRTNYFFPTTTDLALSLGYKLNDRSTIGVGGSYKLGWGQGINHIHMTSEGMGLRSFLDMQIKGSFYASGGYELNYQQPLSLNQLPGLHDWTRSGLIGISKMLSLNAKVVKKTKVQLLWDFLSYSQRPRTQAFKFRVGYMFK